jgi:hypothetical protein
MENKELTEKELWALIKKANWKKDHDYNRIQKEFMAFGEEAFEQLRNFVHNKITYIRNKYEQDWLKSIRVSDDGWDDLCAEIVGRGEKFYTSITVPKMIKMVEDNDYHESFSYAVQRPYKPKK